MPKAFNRKLIDFISDLTWLPAWRQRNLIRKASTYITEIVEERTLKEGLNQKEIAEVRLMLIASLQTMFIEQRFIKYRQIEAWVAAESQKLTTLLEEMKVV